MNRSRREIKTPKRFDEEPFEAPRKSIGKQQPPESAVKPSTPQQPLIRLPKVGPKQTIKVEKDEILTPTPPHTHVEPISKQIPQKASRLSEPQELPSATTTRGRDLIKIKLPSASKPRDVKPVESPKILPVKSPPKPSPAKSSPRSIAVKSPKPAAIKSPKPIIAKPPPVKIPAIKSPTSRSPTLKAPTSKANVVVKSHSFKNSTNCRPTTPPAYDNLIPNVILPFWDARTAADDHEDDNVKELVHCHCGIPEELGLMVQCETCLTWQHAQCLGYDQPEEAPDDYTCKACSSPKSARPSKRWAYDLDWLVKGKMKKFTCDRNDHAQEAETLKKVNQLIEYSLLLDKLIQSLRVKRNILQKADEEDAEFKLFKSQWPTNFVHRDGTHFVPAMFPNSPASTMSAMAGTPDLPVDAVADLREALPDIGQLDVSDILGSTETSTTNDCRSNLEQHIKQMEEFINIELSRISEQIEAIPCDKEVNMKYTNIRSDLTSIKLYLELKSGKSSD